MTPPARSAREPSSSVEGQMPEGVAAPVDAGGGGDPLAEVCEALEASIRTSTIPWVREDCRMALDTLRRVGVVRYLITFDAIGVEHVHTMTVEEAANLAGAPGVHVTPLIAFEEPER